MRKNLLDIAQTSPGDESEELNELVANYISDKEEEARIKKRTSTENNRIKELFEKMNLESWGQVKLSIEKRESFIEDSLIDFLKERGYADEIVKTKEYVDFDALESAMYHEKISLEDQKAMSKCKDIQIIKKLLISKKKGDK